MAKREKVKFDLETLRRTVGDWFADEQQEALRIIDAHAADRAAQEARIAEVEGWYTRAMKDIQALNQSHAADRAALVAQLEVERLRAVSESHVRDNIKAGDEVDSAVTLLEAWRDGEPWAPRATDTFLAAQPATAPDLSRFNDVRAEPSCYAEQIGMQVYPGQPATAPSRTPELDPVVTEMLGLQDRIELATPPARNEGETNTHRWGCVCVRCEAEQAVLDAASRLKLEGEDLAWAQKNASEDLWPLCKAELARRGSKSG